MSKVEKEKTNETSKETLAKKLDDIAVNNKQAIYIRELQYEKEKLKNKIGRKRPERSSTRIQGLAGLQTGLGQQFK